MVTRNVHKECLETLINDLEYECNSVKEIAYENPTKVNIAHSEQMDRVMELVTSRLYELDQMLDKVHR